MQRHWRDVLIIVVGLVLLVLLVLIVAGYMYGWNWVGVGVYETPQSLSSPKSVWDWLSALGIPAGLFTAVWGYVVAQKNAQQDSKVAALSNQIGIRFLSAATPDEKKLQARALTASVLPSLDAKHQAEVVAFLKVGGYIKDEDKINEALPKRVQLHPNILHFPTAKVDESLQFITSDELKTLLA